MLEESSPILDHSYVSDGAKKRPVLATFSPSSRRQKSSEKNSSKLSVDEAFYEDGSDNESFVNHR